MILLLFLYNDLSHTICLTDNGNLLKYIFSSGFGVIIYYLIRFWSHDILICLKKNIRIILIHCCSVGISCFYLHCFYYASLVTGLSDNFAPTSLNTNSDSLHKMRAISYKQIHVTDFFCRAIFV